jgi:predicted RNase H-like nuclease (RuvC/YqgF family)
MGTESGRTGPAIAARRQRTASMLARVEDAVTRLRLDGTPVTVRALAEHARVSATFLYGNPRARVLLSSARAAAARRDTGRSAAAAGQAEASWRERALNAEDALSHAHTEILTQRRLIGELAGTIRDLETPLSTGSAQRITAENTTLHHRIRQLTDEHRTLRERLDAARSTSRFLDRRVADLEAQIAEHIVQAT